MKPILTMITSPAPSMTKPNKSKAKTYTKSDLTTFGPVIHRARDLWAEIGTRWIQQHGDPGRPRLGAGISVHWRRPFRSAALPQFIIHAEVSCPGNETVWQQTAPQVIDFLAKNGMSDCFYDDGMIPIRPSDQDDEPVPQQLPPPANKVITPTLTSPGKTEIVSAASHQPPLSVIIHNAADLLNGNFKPPQHTVQNVLRPGLAIGGGGKSAGKTALALDLGVGVATGEKALGYFNVRRGRVLYIALEQSLTELNELLRLKGVGVNDVSSIDILSAEDGELKPLNDGGLEQVEQWIKANRQSRLVVIDVLERWWSTGGGYSTNYSVLPRLHALGITNDVAILALHHTKKKHEREIVKEILGDTGIVGTSSSVFVLEPPDKHGKARMSVTGRLPTNSYELNFNTATLGFTCVGIWDAETKTPERGAIVLMLKANPKPVSAKDILSEFHKLGRKDKTLEAVKVMLGEMKKDGEVVRVGRGLYTVA